MKPIKWINGQTHTNTLSGSEHSNRDPYTRTQTRFAEPIKLMMVWYVMNDAVSTTLTISAICKPPSAAPNMHNSRMVEDGVEERINKVFAQYTFCRSNSLSPHLFPQGANCETESDKTIYVLKCLYNNNVMFSSVCLFICSLLFFVFKNHESCSHTSHVHFVFAV